MRRETRNWDRIGAFRSLILQSTADIFLACELMGGVHNALATWSMGFGGQTRRIKVGTNLPLSCVVCKFVKCSAKRMAMKNSQHLEPHVNIV